MLYWNQKRHYRLFSSEERALLIDEMSPVWLPKWLKRINLLLNIATPLFLYFYLRLPLREIAFAFIAFDVLLHTFEQVVFITIPWAIAKIPLVSIAQWQYNGATKNLSKVEDRLDVYRKINCEDCNDCINYSRCTNCLTPRELTRKRDKLAETQSHAKMRIDKLRKQTKIATSTTQTTAQPVTPPAPPKQDTTLSAYFQTLSTECNKIISTHRFDFLIAVRKNADSLASILKSKPEGAVEIPGTMCYRLDGLIRLLNNLSAESDEVRTVYFEEAKAVSNELAEEMQHVIMAINKLVPGVDTNTPEMLLTKIRLTKEKNNV